MKLSEFEAIFVSFAKSFRVSEWDLVCQNLIPVISAAVRDFEDSEYTRQLHDIRILGENLSVELIQSHPRFKGQPSEVTARLLENLRRLLVTAEIARELSRRDLAGSEAGDVVRRLQQLFESYPASAETEGSLREILPGGLSTGAGRAAKLLDRYAGQWPAAAALFWILFWLEEDQHLATGEMRVPVIGMPALREEDNSVFLSIQLLKETYNSPLVEHPRNALTPLGPKLLAAMARAFQLAGPKARGAAWQLQSDSTAVHEDSSLTGGASAALRLAAGGRFSYNPECLILADVAEDGEALALVGDLPDKIREIVKLKIDQVILPLVAKSEYETYTTELKFRYRKVEWVGTLTEACTLASGSVGSGVAATNGQKVLERYVLDRCIFPHEQVWVAHELGGEQGSGKVLLKLWEFSLTDPGGNLGLAATRWRRELRVGYRLSSSPGAEECLMRLRDAQVDRKSFARSDRGTYVIAFRADKGGYEPLSSLLGSERLKVPWLAELNHRDNGRDARNLLWRGFRRIARGVHLVHKQRVLHHNVRAESVFCDSEIGPESFRLGGYEWAMRLGDWEWELEVADQPGIPEEQRFSSWISPPESYVADKTLSWAADWYGLGMTAARCLLPFEKMSKMGGKALNESVREHIRDCYLSAREKEFLLALTHPIESKRPGWTEVDSELHLLERGVSAFIPARPGRLCVSVDLANTRGVQLLAAELGKAEPDRESRDLLLAGFDTSNQKHLDLLKTLLRRDLKEARVASPWHRGDGYASEYSLLGSKLAYNITPFYADTRLSDNERWTLAKLSPDRGKSSFELGVESASDSFPVQVYMENNFRPETKGDTRQWTDVLPLMHPKDEIPRAWVHLQQFLRLTNQIELLMRRDEVFRYWIDPNEHVTHLGETTFVRLHESEEGKLSAAVYGKSLGMISSITREWEKGGKEADRVLLSPNQPEPKLWDKSGEVWQLVKPGADGKPVAENDMGSADHILIARTGAGVPPTTGFIRVVGHHGQIALIARRQEAIERLSQHGYLMRALTTPQDVYIDTSSSRSPAHSSPSTSLTGSMVVKEKPDEEQLEKIDLITSTRPIFLLNGPPGTGKSTLVAYSLGAILREEPTAQILVTAQSHGAVDALRQTIQKEGTLDALNWIQRPIEIRLGARNEDERFHQSDRFLVAEKVLRLSAETLDETPPQTVAGRAWREVVLQMQNESQRFKTDSEAFQKRSQLNANEKLPIPSGQLRRFVDLIEEGANVVYATTSAGDLTELAKGDRWFDWTIVEEAGKAHGFDLALPLGSGHRWLLLGDEYQLFPYRLRDFQQAVGKLPQLQKALERLLPTNGRLVDRKLLRWLKHIPENELDEFKRTAQFYLRTFSAMRSNLESADRSRQKPGRSPVRPSCDELTNQYRMHKVIADVISEVFYRDSPLHTKDNAAEKKHGITSPAELIEKPILWLDVKWGTESGPAHQYYEKLDPPRWNHQEILCIRKFLSSLERAGANEILEVAFLSPYAAQVQKLHKQLGPALRERLRYRPGLTATTEGSRRAHTVDSFQGNEADIVFVSLVRNNRQDRSKAFGFLSEAERMNVLISRASRLLILVGCWEFFKTKLESVDREDPDFGHLARLIDSLQRLFEKKQALFLPMDRLD